MAVKESGVVRRELGEGADGPAARGSAKVHCSGVVRAMSHTVMTMMWGL